MITVPFKSNMVNIYFSRANGAVRLFWKGSSVSTYTSIRTKQYNESSVPRNNNGATFVPDFVTAV
jgi:hypothetical protein